MIDSILKQVDKVNGQLEVQSESHQEESKNLLFDFKALFIKIDPNNSHIFNTNLKAMENVEFDKQLSVNVRDETQQLQLIQRVKSHLSFIPPWIQKDNLELLQSQRDLYFHQEILDFMKWAQLDNDGFELRKKVFHQVEQAIKKRVPQCEVFMFGSTASRLALQSSDIDMVVCLEQVKLDILFMEVLEALLESKLFEYVHPIPNARVPLIKLLHLQSGINLDVVFNREDGLKGLCLMLELSRFFPEMRPLYFVLKVYLKERLLHDTYHGGIGSFVLVNLIVHFLQYHYKTKDRDYYLHELLKEFFSYYSIKLDYSNIGVSIRAGGFTFDKQDLVLLKESLRGEKKISIESPLCVLDDLGGQCFRFGGLRIYFKVSLDLLRQRECMTKSFVNIIIPDARQVVLKE